MYVTSTVSGGNTDDNLRTAAACMMQQLHICISKK